MQVITRLSFQAGTINLLPFVTVNSDHLYFTKSAAHRFKLEHNARVNFVNDAREWSFYKTTGSDGFLMQSYSKGIRIHCQPLCRAILRSLGSEKGVSYNLEQRGEYEGQKLIKLVTAKPVEKYTSPKKRKNPDNA